MALWLRIAEFRREFLSDFFSKKQGYTTTPLLIQCDLQGFGDEVLARVEESRQDKDEALFGPWRIAFPQSLDNLTGSMTLASIAAMS